MRVLLQILKVYHFAFFLLIGILLPSLVHSTESDVSAPIIGGSQTICEGEDPLEFSVLTPASGTGTITYQWQNNIAGCSDTFNDIGTTVSTDTYDAPLLTATTYYRVIAIMDDGTGTLCRDTSNCLSITVNNSPTVSLNDPPDVCIDGTDLAFTASPTGGIFTTSASTGFTSNSASGTATLDVSAAGAGTYTINYDYTDGNGCQQDTTISITVNPLPVISLSDPADVCVDGADMTFTASPVGGIFTSTASGLSYNTSSGTATLDVSVAGAGTYDVTYYYTDTNGCQENETVSVTINPLPTVVLNEPADVCVDGTDMTFTATPAGGTFTTSASTGFTSNSASGTATLDVSAAGAGTYTVNYDFTEANGCEDNQSVTVTVHSLPTPIDAPFYICPDEFSTNLTYNNSTVLDGDVGTVTWYDGNPSSGGTSIGSPSTANLHTVGTLYARVTTLAGSCIADIPITVNFVLSPTATCSMSIPPECNTSNGTINVAVSGGTAPYSFLWSNGATTASNVGVGEGTYSVTVSDAHGCMDVCEITIEVSQLLISTNIIQYPSCVGGDGEINVDVTGGDAPYNYSWSNGATTSAQTGLDGGIYTVTVTDANGCIGIATAQLLDLDNVNLGYCVATDIYVANYSNNTITYYDATTGASQGNYTTTGLSAPNSIYQVGDTVYVANGGSVDNIAAYNSTTGAYLGEAVTNSSGLLSFPEQMALGPDGYLYVASQSNGDILYFDPSTFPFTYQGAVSTSFNRPHGLAFDCAGNLYVSENTSGGRIMKYSGPPPYSSSTVLYDYPAGQTPRGLALGPDCNIYANVIISGGARVDSFDMTQSTPISPSTFVTLDAGSTPYAGIFWGPDDKLYIADWGEDEVHAYTTSGSLSYTITAGLSGPHGLYFVTTPTDFSITCNLLAHPTCQNNDGQASVSVSSSAEAPICYLWSTGETTASISGLAEGTYGVTVIDNTGCAEFCSVTLTAANGVAISGLSSNAEICGSENGQITYMVSGGTSPYTFAWHNGAGASGSAVSSNTTYAIQNLPSGFYSVTVTDNLGCDTIATIGIVNNTSNCCTNPDLATTDRTICEGDNVDLSTLVTDGNSIGGSIAYYTSLSDATNQVNPISNTVLPIITTEYYIREDTASCSDIDSLIITVEDQPDAGDDGYITICENSTTLITLADQLSGEEVGGTWLADANNSTSGSFNASSGTFDPTSASDGTYQFHYAFGAGTACIADTSIVTVSINPTPEITVVSTSCSSNLQTYSVIINALGTTVSSSQSGATITNLSGNNYEISNLDTANNVTVTITNITGCSSSLLITRPDCTCPTLSSPISGGNQSMCAGAAIPTITASVGTNEQINWYDAASGGNLLQSNSTSYTPSGPLTVGTHTYFAETQNTLNNCISDNRTSINLTVNEIPNISARDTAVCEGDPVDLSTLLVGTSFYNLTYGPDLTFTGTNLVNPTSTSTYYIQNNNPATGCIDSTAIVVTTINCCGPKKCLPVSVIIKSGNSN